MCMRMVNVGMRKAAASSRGTCRQDGRFTASGDGGGAGLSESPAPAPAPAAPPVVAPLLRLRRRCETSTWGDAGKGMAFMGTGTTDGVRPGGQGCAGALGTTGEAFQIPLRAPINEVQVGSDAELVVTLRNLSSQQSCCFRIVRGRGMRSSRT